MESFHHHDFVSCKCGEISIDGGAFKFLCSARNFENFIRIDDEDKEHQVKYETNEPKEREEPENKAPVESKEDLIKVIEEMINNIERLPVQAQSAPITHYDYQSILLLFLRFLRGI